MVSEVVNTRRIYCLLSYLPARAPPYAVFFFVFIHCTYLPAYLPIQFVCILSGSVCPATPTSHLDHPESRLPPCRGYILSWLTYRLVACPLGPSIPSVFCSSYIVPLVMRFRSKQFLRTIIACVLFRHLPTYLRTYLPTYLSTYLHTFRNSLVDTISMGPSS